MPQGSHGRLLQHHLNQPTTKPTRPLVTQMQPPMLPPPPHPNFQSLHLHAHSQTLPVTSKVLDTTVQYVITKSPSYFTLTSSHTQFEHQGSDVLLIKPDSKGSKIHAVTLASQITEFVTETSVPQPTSNPPMGRPFSSLTLDSYSLTTTQSPEMNNSGSSTLSTASQEDTTQPHQLVSKNEFYQSYHQPTLTQISQTKLEDLGRPLQQRTDSPTLSQISPSVHQQSFTQRLFPKFHLELLTTQPYLASTQPPYSVTKPQQFLSQPLPTLSQLTSTISTLPQNQPRPSPTQHPLLHAQSPPPQSEAFPLQHREPSIPTLHPPDQTSEPSTSAPEIRFVHQVNMSDQVQLNNSQQGDTVQSVKTPNDTELTEWLKRNTSQSPMTSNDPR